MDNTLLAIIAQESLLLFLIIGSFFALLLGLLFVLSPPRARALSHRCNRWFSLRRPTKPLEVSHDTDHYLYRHHRAFGLFILVSASYILYRFAFDFEQNSAIQTISHAVGYTVIVEWLVEALIWFILPVSVLLLLFGASMASKPSALKGAEALANRWISTRKALQPLDKQNKSLDIWVQRRPLAFGILLILAASYNLLILIVFLFNHLH